MKPFKKVHVIVMDSVGIGEAPDADQFGDVGADTLGHIAEKMNGLKMPVMESLGLSNIRKLQGIQEVAEPKAFYGMMQEASVGKDTMTGHWEIMGLNIDKPFKVYPEGFPQELITKLEQKIGRKVLCNLPYSGTEVINDSGLTLQGLKENLADDLNVTVGDTLYVSIRPEAFESGPGDNTITGIIELLEFTGLSVNYFFKWNDTTLKAMIISRGTAIKQAGDTIELHIPKRNIYFLGE